MNIRTHFIKQFNNETNFIGQINIKYGVAMKYIGNNHIIFVRIFRESPAYGSILNQYWWKTIKQLYKND